MASLNKAISKDFFENILPTYGNPRKALPSWDEEQKMFICDQYLSAAGNLSYKGVRFCNNIAVVETVGKFHCWTYINSIELYAFNGKKPELVQRKEYAKVFYNSDLIRKETENMLCNYLNGAVKINGGTMPVEYVREQAKNITENCYKSFLDKDYNTRLTQILPLIEG